MAYEGDLELGSPKVSRVASDDFTVFRANIAKEFLSADIEQKSGEVSLSSFDSQQRWI